MCPVRREVGVLDRHLGVQACWTDRRYRRRYLRFERINLVVETRRRNLWPLPGGAAAYAETLQTLMRVLGSGRRRSEFEALVGDRLPSVSSATTVRGYVSVLVTLGFAEIIHGQLVPTADGKKFARSGDPAVLRRALVDRVYGVRELIETVAEQPMAYPELRERLEAKGVSWNNAMAVRYRVWWLVAAGAITAERVSRADLLRVTRAGRACARER